MQEIRTIDSSKCLKKTTFPDSNPRAMNSMSVKKTINPDESFFNDILNFDDTDDAGDTSDHTSPKLESKSKPNIRKTKDNVATCDISPTDDRTVSRKVRPLRKPLGVGPRAVIGSHRGESDQFDAGVRLSLFEFSHIRVQETRGQLETDPDLTGDLAQGRTCFCCRAVRFRMLNWAYNCHFCKKNVCSSCFVKLRLPVEKLKEVTVASLISQLSPTNESKTEDRLTVASPDTGFVRSSLNRISLRTAAKPKPGDNRKSSSPAPTTSLASASMTGVAYRPRMLR